MLQKQIFISYDTVHDLDLKVLLEQQATQAEVGYQVSGCSTNTKIRDWAAHSRATIAAADAVIVICGHNTDAPEAPSAAILMAREEGKPYFLLAGRFPGTNRKPTAALAGDLMNIWTRSAVKELLIAAAIM